MTALARMLVTFATAASFTSDDPVLRLGEMGVETDTDKLKIGDGVTAWTALAYVRGETIGNVKDYGAVGDGVTNDQAAFAAAAAAVSFVYVPNGTYVIETPVDIQDNQTWLFDGATLKHTVDTQIILRASSKTNFSLLGRLVLLGTLTTPASAAEVGLQITNGKRFRVEGVEARKFKGIGIQVTGTSAGTLRGDRGSFTDCAAHENTTGIQVDAGAGAEYNTWSNTNVSGNVDGWIMGAGNNTVVGGCVVDNTRYGVKLVNGTNHGHGQFVGVNINHNTTYNLYAIQVTNGYTFVGCHFYGSGSSSGALFLDRCKGIVITGGHLDCWVYNDKDGSSGYNYARGVYCPGSNGAVTLGGGANPGTDEFVFTECYGTGAYLSAVTINDPSPVYLLAERAAAATQSLTSGVGADLVFPTEVFDRRLAYNNSTGVFTVPAGQDGVYRIRAALIFSGTAMSSTTSYVDVKVGSASKRLFTPTAFSTTILTITVDTELHLAASNTVKLNATIIGTSPTFGNSTWGSNLSIERVS